jgi:hypothetical protein
MRSVASRRTPLTCPLPPGEMAGEASFSLSPLGEGRGEGPCKGPTRGMKAMKKNLLSDSSDSNDRRVNGKIFGAAASLAVVLIIMIFWQMGPANVANVANIANIADIVNVATVYASQVVVLEGAASSAPLPVYASQVGQQQSLWTGAGAGTVTQSRGFQKISEDGFGSRHNSYAWSSAWFKGKLYVGTNRDMICYLSVVFGVDASLITDADCQDPDYRGEIWAYNPENGGTWERVYQSPMATPASGGSAVPRDQGYRGMIAVVEPDGTEALYVGGFTSKEVLPVNLPARLLRSVDGVTFTEVKSSDSQTLKDSSIFGLRSFTMYNKKLYMTANMDPPQRPRLLEADLATLSAESSGETTMDVRQVNSPDIQPFELEVFNNYLYVGTIDTTNGYSVLKTRATGNPPYTFTPVVTHGAWRKNRLGKESYNLNEYVLSMCVFQDRLYIGSGCGLGGYDFETNVGPASAELIRINKDDTWQLVCGMKRTTQDGIKVPLSHLPAGMGNPFTGYFWRMAVHHDWLYVATMDASIALRNPDVMSLLDPNKVAPNGDYTQLVQMGLGLVGFSWPWSSSSSGNDPAIKSLVSRIGESATNLLGGFDLWKTRNGVQWFPVTTTGFGDKFNIGARTMVSTPIGLFIGTANPYYGAQVWLGEDSFPFARNLQTEPMEGAASSDPDVVKLRWTAPADTVATHILRKQLLAGIGNRDYPGDDLFVGILGEDNGSGEDTGGKASSTPVTGSSGSVSADNGTSRRSSRADGNSGIRLSGLMEVAATAQQYYIDANVVEGAVYLYQVRCENAAGDVSELSNISLCRVPGNVAQILTPRPRPDRTQGQWTQQVTLFNTTDTTIVSALQYILEGLSSDTTVLNRSGTAENGSPYLQVPVGRGGLLPGQRLQLQLRFQGPRSSSPRFNYIPFLNTDPVEP